MASIRMKSIYLANHHSARHSKERVAVAVKDAQEAVVGENGLMPHKAIDTSCAISLKTAIYILRGASDRLKLSSYWVEVAL